MFSKEQFGARMKQARELAGKSQATAAKDLGVTPAMLCDIEKGRRTTTIERFATFAAYYGISADYLLGLKDEMK